MSESSSARTELSWVGMSEVEWSGVERSGNGLGWVGFSGVELSTASMR